MYQITSLQIKEMMVNAQRMIEERKRALEQLGSTGVAGGLAPPGGMLVPPVGVVTAPQLSTPAEPMFDGTLQLL